MISGKIKGYMVFVSEYGEEINGSVDGVSGLPTYPYSSKKEVIKHVRSWFEEWYDGSDTEYDCQDCTTLAEVIATISSLRDQSLKCIAVYSFSDCEFLDLTEETNSQVKIYSERIFSSIQKELEKAQKAKEKRESLTSELAKIESDLGKLVEQREDLLKQIRNFQ